MYSQKFICTLLSDVILSVNSSAQGIKETLDFIPGNNFLGIVAKQLYDNLSEQEQLSLFHCADVHFGDAHPCKNGHRAFRIPAAFYYPKYDAETIYVHHSVDHNQLPPQIQLKQCRSGFYIINNGNLEKVGVHTNIAVKSAYDTVNRRSEDEQMYTYQSMEQGMTLAFEVQANTREMLNKIVTSLCGVHSIGRSRTAQYGRVEITMTDYQEIDSLSISSSVITIYADSRLIFLDQYGMPTMQPKAEDFGLQGRVLWDKSQVRTFQYAPWNGKRQEWDLDRCGIEKGSVFVVECSAPIENIPSIVGVYTNEGFGKVICNPSFLQTLATTNGKSPYSMPSNANANTHQIQYHTIGECDTVLIEMLMTKKSKAEMEQSVYEAAKTFVNNNKGLYSQAKFKSQWGQIRSIAMSKPLDTIQKEVITYLEKGIKKSDWAGKPLTLLKKAMDSQPSPETLQLFLVNVASRMAKQINK